MLGRKKKGKDEKKIIKKEKQNKHERIKKAGIDDKQNKSEKQNKKANKINRKKKRKEKRRFTLIMSARR